MAKKKILKLNEVMIQKNIYLFMNLITGILFIVALLTYEKNPSEFIKYVGCQVILIYGQGRIVLKLLKVKLGKDMMFILSYFIGISIIILEYLIAMGLFKEWRLIFFGYAIGVIGFVFQVKETKKSSLFRTLNSGLVTIGVFLCVVTFLSLTVKNSMPDIIGRSAINQDLLWSVGNTQSLMRSYPPIDARMSGIPFMYHYFVNIYYAVTALTTGIDAVTLYFVYGYIIKTMFLVGSVYIFGKTFLKDRTKSLFYTVIYFFTACASLNRVYANGYGIFMNSNLRHISDGAFGFELSIAFLLVLISLIFHIVEEKEWVHLLIPASLLFFALAGTKGPLALMIILVFIAVIVLLFITRQGINKKMVSLLTIFSLIFIVMFTFLLKSGGGDLNFELGYVAKSTPIYRKIIGVFGENILSTVILIPAHMYAYLPFGMVLFVIWFVMRVKKIKECNVATLVVGGIAVLGIMCGYIFKHYGHSEIYFLMTAIPFLEVAAVQLFFSKKNKGIITMVALISLGIGMTTAFYSFKGRIDIGMKYNQIIQSGIEFTKGYHPNTIKNEEYKGIKWLADNTPKDALILSDRYYISKEKKDRTARYFYYSTLSNRQFYLEGYFYYYAPEEYRERLGEKLINSEKIYGSGDYKLAKQEGIDYVILSKNLYNQYKSIEGEGFINMFENDDIIVYKVQ